LQKIGKAKTKYIPREFLNLPINNLQYLFKSIIAGDGYTEKGKKIQILGKTVNSSGRKIYYTSSKQLADDFQELATKLGYATRLKFSPPKKWVIKGKSGINSGLYEISILKSKNTNLLKKEITTIDYNDMVYDVETKQNHSIFVRRKGHCVWSSNCTSDNVPGLVGVGEKTVINYLLGNLPEHHKTYQKIKDPKNVPLILRNKKLVCLPYKGTPIYDIDFQNIPTKKGIKKVGEKYNFSPIQKDFKFWCKILRGFI
jgi:hypothetical protein